MIAKTPHFLSLFAGQRCLSSPLYPDSLTHSLSLSFSLPPLPDTSGSVRSLGRTDGRPVDRGNVFKGRCAHVRPSLATTINEAKCWFETVLASFFPVTWPTANPTLHCYVERGRDPFCVSFLIRPCFFLQL